VGPNGAGKSTVLRALGRLVAASGTARFGHTDLLQVPVREHAEVVAYMPQVLPQGVRLSVFEAVLSAAHAASDRWTVGADEARQVVALLDRVGLTADPHRMLDELSGGERQLASFAQSLVRNPPILLLDEPTSALDLAHQVTVMGLIRELAREGHLVMVVLHDLNLAVRWADRVVALRDGKVVASGPPSTALTPDVLAATYGVRARVERCSRGEPHVLVDGLVQARDMEFVR
jgi:iron complex transport system ATP-binding protein